MKSIDTSSPAQNLQLIREIEANRLFLLQAYRDNPDLLKHAEERVKALLLPLPQIDSASAGPEGRIG